MAKELPPQAELPFSKASGEKGAKNVDAVLREKLKGRPEKNPETMRVRPWAKIEKAQSSKKTASPQGVKKGFRPTEKDYAVLLEEGEHPADNLSLKENQRRLKELRESL